MNRLAVSVRLLGVVVVSVFGLLAALFYGVFDGSASADAPAEGESSRLVVVTDPSTSRSEMAELVDDLGADASLVSHSTRHDLMVVDVPAEDFSAAKEQLADDDAVVAVERDTTMHAFAVTPNDPLWSYQSSIRQVGFDQAWTTTTGSAAVTIAIIDGGVSPVSDLAGRLLPGRNLVKPGTAPNDDTASQHGTNVALLAAGGGNNADGIAGVCWACRVLPIKVLDSTGSGYVSDIATAIYYAVDEGASVINLSLGSVEQSAVLSAAVDYAVAHEVVVAAAAGNDSLDQKNYPAADNGVLAVGGTTERSTLSPSSNFGDWVDLGAPFINMTPGPTGAEPFAGTSSATPLVVGAAALLKSFKPQATQAQIFGALSSTATPVPGGGIHYGEINVASAMNSIASIDTWSPYEPPTTTTPTVKDVTPPVVAVDALGEWSDTSVDVSISATDASGVPVVQVYRDGVLVRTLSNPAVSSRIPVDVHELPNGRHTLEVRATDAFGNTAAATDTVLVDHAPPVAFIATRAPATVRKPFDVGIYTGDENGVIVTYLVADGKVVGGYPGGGMHTLRVPVTRSGTLKVVAVTADSAGRISWSNVIVRTAKVRR